jgi:hypothetical protein
MSFLFRHWDCNKKQQFIPVQSEGAFGMAVWGTDMHDDSTDFFHSFVVLQFHFVLLHCKSYTQGVPAGDRTNRTERFHIVQ